MSGRETGIRCPYLAGQTTAFSPPQFPLTLVRSPTSPNSPSFVLPERLARSAVDAGMVVRVKVR